MSEITKPANRLLAALPAKEYARMLPKLEEIPLTYAQIICESGDASRHVYFPNSGIVCLLCGSGERSLLEIGIIGSEGFVGLPVFHGVKASNYRTIVQGAGAAWKMKTTDFLAECRKGGALPRLLNRYTYSLLTEISQLLICNRFHSAQTRLARWLLMTGDRMMADEFQITQEFLSDMLGVRREAVCKSAAILQQNNLISYRRGSILILNRAGLEAAACRCYLIIKEEYDKFSPGFKTRQKGC